MRIQVLFTFALALFFCPVSLLAQSNSCPWYSAAQITDTESALTRALTPPNPSISATLMSNLAPALRPAAPGELLSIYGSRIVVAPDATNFSMPKELAGVSLLVNGKPTGLMSVGKRKDLGGAAIVGDEIIAQLPMSLSGDTFSLQVTKKDPVTGVVCFGNMTMHKLLKTNPVVVPYAIGMSRQLLTLYATGLGALADPVWEVGDPISQPMNARDIVKYEAFIGNTPVKIFQVMMEYPGIYRITVELPPLMRGTYDLNLTTPGREEKLIVKLFVP